MKLFWAALSCIFCTGHISFAEPRLTYNSYGMPGLVDMPSSQSAPDAELSFSISQAGKSLRNTLMFQITPRLTGAFRYSSIERPGSTLYDRSFDLRYRLLDETDRRPAIAVGLQDFISTGVYNGEYIAASKNLGPVIASGALPHLNVFGKDYDTRDGTGERDYIHVCDLARGHVLSMQKLLSTHEGHVVNLGTGQAYSVLEMNAAYSQAVGRDLPYVIAPRRAGDVPTCLADVRKAKAVLDFETQFGLADMCQSSWNWIETQARS
jgi:hypothetical protein